MDCRFAFYDDPPAPEEPPQAYTPLSPPKTRLRSPSSSRLTLQCAPADSRPQTSQTRTSCTTATIRSASSPHPPDATDVKNKPRTRALSCSRPATSFELQVLTGAKANLPPPATTTMPYIVGLSSLNLTRRGTLSVASMSDRRDSVDTRSMISSILDAYCRSDTMDDAWYDDVDDFPAAETPDYNASASSVCTPRCRRGSTSTIVDASELPTKRPKPASLLIEAASSWDSLASSSSAPQTAPVTKNLRPLPPLPPPNSSQRPNIRPLPRTPTQSPPYTPLADDRPASTSALPPVPSLSFSHHSASSTSSSSSTTVSSTSNSTASSNRNRFTHRPKISKYHLLPPLLTIPASPSSQEPSPLDIPVPPSPMTARRHQATKLTKLLGEEISPELLGPNRLINRASHLPVSCSPAAQTVNQRQTNKVMNDVSLPPTRRVVPSRAWRPRAIYDAHDDVTSEEEESNAGDVHKEGDSSENLSLSDFADHEEEEIIIDKGGIKIDLSVDESDDTASSEADIDEVLSPSDSILEEMDDMEEARIGWALQNVITYQKAARVKRTSRMWVLEKNGQRWEEQDHTNILQALRQL